MRTIVRLLRPLAFLGIAAAALVVLAEWATDAHADTPIPEPAGADALPAVTLPPTPPLPTVPSQQETLGAPSVTVPAPPTVPALSPVASVPSVSALLPDTPAVPELPTPPDPAAIDPTTITNVLGPLPGVPAVTPPEPPALPSLPALPDPPLPAPPLPEPPLPDPALPAPGPIEIAVLPAPPIAVADQPGLAPTVSAPDAPAPSRSGLTDGGGLFAVLAGTSPPARAPPSETPLHPCPGGGASNSGRADPPGSLSPGADAATRRASLLSDACSCASTVVLDPLLRPD